MFKFRHSTEPDFCNEKLCTSVDKIMQVNFEDAIYISGNVENASLEQENKLGKLISEHSEIKQTRIEQCDWPDCVFSSNHRGGMATHTKSHQLLSCSHCIFTTNKSLILYKHMNQWHNKYSYICDTCGKSTSSPENLKKHNDRIHKKIKFQCEICPLRTYRLKTHYDRTHGHKMLFCKSCEFKTSRPDNLKRHVNLDHSQISDIKRSNTNQCLENTGNTDHGLDNKSLGTSSCAMVQDDLGTGLLAVLGPKEVVEKQQYLETKPGPHLNVKFIPKDRGQQDICLQLGAQEICNELVLENTQDMVSQEKIKLDISLNTIDSQKTKTPNNFEDNHKYSIKEEIDIYSAKPLCDVEIKPKNLPNLSAKVPTSRTRCKTFICNYCGKVFAKNESLNNHENSLHRDVKYACEKCPYKGYNIQDHLKRQHGEKKYQCNSCDYKSSKPRDLTCHMVSKHPVSPVKSKGETRMERLSIKLYSDDGVQYKCKTCSYTTASPSNIYKHDIKHRRTEWKTI